MEKFDLTPAEWNIMECLWERAPQTGRELTEQLEASMGWSRSTTLTLLRRMVGKGVVTCDTEGTKNTFSPAVRREDAALAETETFLDRVYQGSLSLMVSAMTREGAWHCNQKCLHCYAAGQTLGQRPELTTDQWKALLEKLRRANIPQVTFTGGEPTLRQDLVELVEAAQWFVTRLNTNGRLLTPELCRRLYEASLDSVQVTLYSADPSIHNALVGAEGFDDTVAGIRSAVASGLSVSVNTPLCSVNSDYAATLRFVHDLGVRYVTCSGLIPSGSAESGASRATALTEQQLTDVLSAAVKTAEALELEIDFTSPGWLKEETLRALGLTLIPSCGACLSNMAIAPDGEIIPCQSWLSSKSLGSILNDDWDAVWQGERCAAIRAKSAKMEQLCQLRESNREEAVLC